MGGEGLKELLHQPGVKIPNLLVAKGRVVDQGGSASEVYGHVGQGLLHRDAGIPKPDYPLLVPEGLPQGRPEAYPHVLYRVGVIYLQVSPGIDLQIKTAMFGEELEHVVQEDYAGGALKVARTVQFQGEAYLRLSGLSVYLCSSWHFISNQQSVVSYQQSTVGCKLFDKGINHGT